MPAAYALFYAMMIASALFWGRRSDVPAEAPTTETPTDTDEAI